MPTTPMSSLEGSNSRVYYPYSNRDSYVVPYSSDRTGGELITEYNQRIALNTLCSRRADLSDYAKTVRDRINSRYGVSTVVDQTTGETELISAGLNSFINYQEYANPTNWRFNATATGTQSDTDFELTVLGGGSSIQISKGSAIINGYCVESTIAIELDAPQVLTTADVDAAASNPEQVSSNPIVSKFIKLGMMYVDSTGNTHDERLNPPVDGLYMSVAIIVDDSLPDASQLLLGTVTRNRAGTFLVVNNPTKTRILPIDAVSGAENYDTLLGAGDAEAGHIYGIGVLPGASGYLRDITDTLWLNKSSTIAKLIRGLAAQPDTATVDPKKTTRGLITTVGLNQGEGDVTQALRTSTGPTTDYPSIYYQQAYATDADASAKIDKRDVYFPFANSKSTMSGSNIIEKVLCEPTPIGDGIRHYDYQDVRFPELDFEKGGISGFITSQQAYMIEKTYAYMCNPENQHRQYGPFSSVSEAAKWFRDHPTIQYELGDYFWVINDDLKMVTSGTASTADPTLTAVETSFGNIAGTITGSVSGTVTGEVSGTTESDPIIAVRGTVTGNTTGTAAGSVTGTFASITQYVSARYSCIYKGETTSTVGVSRIVRYAEQTPNSYPIDKYPDDTSTRGGVVDGDVRKAWFALQSVERGFGIPASAEMYGLVKCPADTETSDPMAVVRSTSDGNLKITKSLYTTIQNNGYQLNTEEAPTFYISAPRDLSEFSKTYFTGTATFVLNGDASIWEQAIEEFKTLSDIKGHVILDYRNVTVNKYADQPYYNGNIFTLRNVDYVTLLGDTSPISADLEARTSTSALRLTVDHCVVDTPFFTNIGHWFASRFISGSNTLELSNPWMRVDKVFTLNDNISNQLEARFASVTMGEKGVTSAEMDIRIRYEANVNNSNSVDNCWTSLNRIKFPPLMFKFERITPDTGDNSVVTTDTVDLHTIQYIPTGLILKIGATAGVHEVLNVANSEQYVVSGNLLAVVDWGYNTHNEIGSTPEEKLYFNLYMKNSSGDARQRISNFSVRVPVQVINGTNNSPNQYATYESVYQTTLGN